VAEGGVTRRYSSGTRWCLWRWTDVLLRGEVYLTRLHLVQTPWFAVMLHWIRRPDPQPHLHDHPVSFASILLRGGYEEATTSGPRRKSRVSLKRAVDRHRITSVEPGTLTLVLAGPVVRAWGHWVNDEWIPWRTYQETFNEQ
jgi:hypothetical protein